MSYWDLLRKPRWQQRRLEVMARAGWACEDCGDKDTTFNVHHTHYVKGRKPWEYDDEDLRCLCEPCHKLVTDQMAELVRLVGRCRRHDRELILGFVRVRSWAFERVAIDSPAIAAGTGLAVGNISTDRVLEMAAEALADGESTVDVGDLFIEFVSTRPNRPTRELEMEYEPAREVEPF